MGIVYWWYVNFLHQAPTLFNSNIAGLGCPGPTSIDLIYNKATFTAALAWKNFFIMHFTNFMHSFSWPLLQWWYDDDTDCSMFSSLQKSLNFFATKSVPMFNIILLGSPYSENKSQKHFIRLSADSFLIISPLEICCSSLQYKENYCY